MPDDLGRPVTMATARASELRSGIRSDIAALTGRLAELAAQLERAGDPEAAAAQVETIQAESAQDVAEARTLLARQAHTRQLAEADAGEARAAGDAKVTQGLDDLQIIKAGQAGAAGPAADIDPDDLDLAAAVALAGGLLGWCCWSRWLRRHGMTSLARSHGALPPSVSASVSSCSAA